MALAYSKEFRREVLAACDAGLGTHEAASKFGCSKSWVRRIKQERRESGKTEPKRTRNRVPDWYAYREQIEQAISRQPDLTLAELKLEIGTTLSRQTLCTALHRLKLTLKKKS